MRVMTFNVQGATWPKDGPNAWPERAELNVATIRRSAPDLVGLQEVQEANLRAYRDGLGEYALFRGNNYGDVPSQEWTTVLWRADRFTLVEGGELWFSSTPDRPSSGFGVAYPMGATWVRLRDRRGGTWVRLRDRRGGTELVHLNTHFEDGPRGELSRREGARLIVERLDRLQADGAGAVVTGDFNCNPGSAPHAAFLAAGFADAYLAAGHADGVDSTYHGFEGAAYSAERYGGGANAFWRIDWVLTRGAGLRTAGCTIVRDADPPRYPSDHYPVVADLRPRGAPAPGSTG
jgi:endonuclease/exonuclease/phosphatase family metal-dependent hydrolase